MIETVDVKARPEEQGRAGPPTPASRPHSAPITWWAGLGLMFLGLQAYVFSRWLFSSHLRATPRGPDPIPHSMHVSAVVNEILGPVLGLFCLYWFVIRPWRQGKRWTVYGLFLLASLTSYWQNTAGDWATPAISWNTAFVNLGSWYSDIPGWVAPKGNSIAEPLIFMIPVYLPLFLLPAICIRWTMKRAEQRWPRVGMAGLCLLAYLGGVAFDFAIELTWTRLGLYTHVGTHPSWTLFAGHYYQFPIYEALLWGVAWGSYACLLHFVDGEGRTIAERGLDKLRGGLRKKTLLRFLALVGFINLVFAGYNLAYGLVSMQPGMRWIGDVQNRSYLTDQLCGRGTTYACPGAELPLPRGDHAIHVGPDGVLVIPGPRS
jgi:hypothetical protein